MTPNEKQITQIYIGFLSRAADRDGRDYWVSAANSGLSITQIADSFAVQPEFTAIYGGLSNGQLIDEIYDNLFGRAADAAGKAYWQSYLDNGGTAGQLMVHVMNGAQGADKLKLDNAAIVADQWTSLTPGPFDIEQARLAISTIDEIQPGSGGGLTVNITSPELTPWADQLNATLKAAWYGWELHFPNDVQIQIDLGYVPIPGTPGNELLASASTRMEVLTESGYTLTGLVQEINTGRDPNGFQSDGFINLHMEPGQFFSQFDATSVFRHEFGHMLAVRSGIVSGGLTSYDRHIKADGGFIRFEGPETVLAYGGPVPIHHVGSFINWAHVDDGSLLMYPYFSGGEVRTVGAVDVAMLYDSGLA